MQSRGQFRGGSVHIGMHEQPFDTMWPRECVHVECPMVSPCSMRRQLRCPILTPLQCSAPQVLKWVLYLFSSHVVYAGVHPVICLVFRKRVHALLTAGQSRKACCSVSVTPSGHIRQVLGSPRRSRQTPTGKPLASTSHCIAETLRGRYGCQILLKNLARVLLLYPAASSSKSTCSLWLSCLSVTVS